MFKVRDLSTYVYPCKQIQSDIYSHSYANVCTYLYTYKNL